MESRGPTTGLPKLVVVLLAIFGVPAAGIVSVQALRADPWLVVMLTVGYELTLLLVGFAAAVGRQLGGRWTTRAADVLDATLLRVFSRYTRHYLRYVMADTRYVDLKGVSTRAEYTLEMRDIYVRLSLDEDPATRLRTNPVDQVSIVNGVDIWEWLRGGRIGSAIAILCPPGTGKTTLLRNVAHVTATGGRLAARHRAPRKIPVVIYLRDHKDWTFFQ